jgi:outer membrane immunogenic protein
MRKHRAASATVIGLVAFAAAAANAADLRKMPVKAPPAVASASSWTQFYAGGGIGLNAETGKTGLGAGGAADATLNVDGLQGANLGLTATAGFDLQVSPMFVVGAFADYDWSHQDTTITVNTFPGVFTATSARLDGGWTVGGRAGFLVTPDVLFYGLGGFTRMRLDNWGLATTGFSLQEPTLTLNGYSVGAGIEYRLANNVSLRGEYRYVSLGRATTVDAANNLTWVTDASAHIGRIVAAYRFGGPGMSAPPAPPRPIPAAWNGFYGAVGFGGDAISQHVNVDIAPAQVDLDTTGLGGADIAATLMVGFDHQFVPGWVAGVFGNFDVGTNGTANFAVGAGVAGPVISADVAAMDKSWTAGGRLGYLIAPDALLYGLAGYTMTSFHPVSYNLFNIAMGTAPLPDFHGITIGAGFEKLIVDNLSVRAEYRNTRLDAQSGYPATGLDYTFAQPTINSVRLLLAYRLATR